jgi:hypothetical protein
MISTSFTYLKDFVYELNLELDFDKQEIIDDLHNEEWEGTDSAYGINAYTLRLDVKSNNIKSPRLQSIINHFAGDEFKWQMINTFYETAGFSGYWALSPERLFNATGAMANLVCDKPGFFMAPHVDARIIVASGMCYFSSEDDFDLSTTFYDNAQGKNPLRMKTNFGKGWLAANMQDSFHGGWNKSNYNRYTLMFGLGLKC